MFVFASCNKTEGTEDTTNAPGNPESASLRFGLGIVSEYGDVRDADGDSDGKSSIEITAVSVLLDTEGRIADVVIDVLDASAEWTSEGKAVASTEVKTKYETGADYNMAVYGKKHDGSDGKVLEWFEQIDAFAATAKGKTVSEIKTFMTEDTYTTGDLAAAGCTISVGNIMKALDKAVADAVESKAASDDALNLAFATSVTNTDATEEKDGSVAVDATIVAAVVNADGKVVVAKTDVASASVTFNLQGESTTDVAAELKTKVEAGDGYNMAVYGKKHDGSDGKVLEWYVQAAAFDSFLEGKTAADFSVLADAEGYGTGDLATAGCTINISNMIKAAEAAATVD